MTFAHIKTQKQMADYAVRLTQAGAAHHVPLVQAAMAGVLRFAILLPGTVLPSSLLKLVPDPRPLAVVLGGDGELSSGPDDFPQAKRLVRWAAGIMLHAAGGEPEHYLEAVRATVLLRRLLLVETTTARETEWTKLASSLAPETPKVRITVRPNKPAHPYCGVPAGAVVQ